MVDKSSLFNVFLDHGLQLGVTCLVQDYSRKQIIDQAQEQRFVLVNLQKAREVKGMVLLWSPMENGLYLF